MENEQHIDYMQINIRANSAIGFLAGYMTGCYPLTADMDVMRLFYPRMDDEAFEAMRAIAVNKMEFHLDLDRTYDEEYLEVQALKLFVYMSDELNNKNDK